MLTLGDCRVRESVVKIQMAKFKYAQFKDTKINLELDAPDMEEKISTTDEEYSDNSESSDYEENNDVYESDF